MRTAAIIARKGTNWKPVEAGSNLFNMRRRFKIITGDAGKIGRKYYDEVQLLESSGGLVKQKKFLGKAPPKPPEPEPEEEASEQDLELE